MRKRDLIVPIHDRRKRKRYLTLKNVGIAMLVCFVAFVAISIRSEMRGRGPVDYGGHESKLPPPPEPKPVEVIDEAPVSTFVQQQLGEPMPPPDPIPVAVEPPPAPANISINASLTGGDDVAIVGGPEGVAVVQKERRRPALSGGFGRPDS